MATAAMGSLPTALVPGVGATTAASGALIPGAAAIPATAGSGILGAAGTALGLGGTAAAGTATAAGAGAAGMAAMAPMLAAAGPFALMALPFLLNNGTKKVPGYGDGTPSVNNKYGDDPFAPSGPSFVESQPAASSLGGMFNYVPDAYQVSNYLTSLFGDKPTGTEPYAPSSKNYSAPLPSPTPNIPNMAGPVEGDYAQPMYHRQGPVEGDYAMPSYPMYQQGPPPSTPPIPMPSSSYNEQLANYTAAGYNNGVAGVLGEHLKNPLGLAGVAGRALGFNNGTNMAYAGGEDTVPTVLTVGEAVIPAAAAQNPNNQPMIDSMIEEGREANAIAKGQAPQAPVAAQAPPPMAGPLSGPAQRAQVESLQDMAMKKKAFEAEEMRKQQAFEQKLALDKQKALMSMQT
jgi:hypothetical protein